MLLKQLLSFAIVATVLGQFQVHAQFYNNSGCSSCGTAPQPMPIMSQTSCTPVMPVQSTCYQTVPVTTFRKERQKVREPYYKTEVEKRKVTVMKPVTRQRTVEVPTVSYKTVVENRTTQRDLGRWQTNYQPVSKCAPCQVDPRPGMIGWLNRTGYSFRSSFIPNYRTTRQYVPKMVVCNTPVTRQVAVPGTKRVVVNETEMVPETKVVEVTVQKLAYREKEITVNVPQTAYRTVPMGTTTAYGYGGGTSLAYGLPYGYGSSVAFVDDDEERDSTRSANRPEKDPLFGDPDVPRTSRPFDPDDDKSFKRSQGDERFERSSYQKKPQPSAPRQVPRQTPNPFSTSPPEFPPSTKRDSRDSRIQPASYRPPTERRTVSRGWKASTRSPQTDRRTASSKQGMIKSLSMTD